MRKLKKLLRTVIVMGLVVTLSLPNSLQVLAGVSAGSGSSGDVSMIPSSDGTHPLNNAVVLISMQNVPNTATTDGTGISAFNTNNPQGVIIWTL